MKTGEKLKKCRIECGLSVKEVYELTGIDRSVIYRIERGDIRNPTLKDVNKMCKVYKVKIEEMV